MRWDDERVGRNPHALELMVPGFGFSVWGSCCRGQGSGFRMCDPCIETNEWPPVGRTSASFLRVYRVGQGRGRGRGRVNNVACLLI